MIEWEKKLREINIRDPNDPENIVTESMSQEQLEAYRNVKETAQEMQDISEYLRRFHEDWNFKVEAGPTDIMEPCLDPVCRCCGSAHRPGDCLLPTNGDDHSRDENRWVDYGPE